MQKKHEILNSKIVAVFILFLLWFSKINAASVSITIDWVQAPCAASAGKITGGFTNVQWELKDNRLVPYYSQKIPGALVIADFKMNEEIECDQLSISGVESESYIYRISIIQEQGSPYSVIYVYPVRYTESGVMKLLSKFSLEMNEAPITAGNKLGKKGNSESSKLSAGKWYKMGVSKSGIYKIDADLLSKMGINPTGTALKSIKVFGNGGLMLPEPISQPRADDLVENPLYVQDQNGNNKMDGGDYLLFYAQGPNGWKFDSVSNIFRYSYHYYDNEAYYFLTIDGIESKRISERNDGQGNVPAMTIREYDYLFHREFNEKNVIRSGREWFSPVYKDDKITIANFSEDIPLATQPVTFRTRLAVRALSGSSLSIRLNNNTIVSRFFSPVSGDYDKDFMTPPEIIEGNTSISSGKLDISFDFSKPLNSDNVFIDYYELHFSSALKFSGEPLTFRKKETRLNDFIEYEIAGTPQMIWDISDILNPMIQHSFSSSGTTSFLLNSEGNLKEFIAFNPGSLTDKPSYIGKVENQNLHALKDIEYIIISHPNFKDEAKRLGEFHLNREGYSFSVVSPQQIYNEFSSGAQDLTAIRDFLKMLYDRGQGTSKRLKYVLMFGDASYNYKDKLSNNTNFVPTFESPNSYSPTHSYCSDDYFVILDDNEGFWGTKDAMEGLDVGIGRIPASSKEDAKIAVDKVMYYHLPEAFGEWRNQLAFLADDEDGNTHLNDAEQVTNLITGQVPSYNINKIYLDAFKQVSFGSGPKYPDVNTTIDAAMDKGNLIFDYLGHGGGSGMAHERVITRSQISSWSNKYKLPLFITATCQLTQFDDPVERSPGELIFFNPKGGGIGLISTSRVVYIGLNSDLNEAVINHNIFEKRNGSWPTLGDVYRDCKNNSVREVNQRNFILIGDPALTLAYPEKSIVTTKINNMELDTISDTLRALSIVTIEGEVRDGATLDDQFSGTVYPTVYDKFLSYKTLGNDPQSPIVDYEMQNSVLYRGIVSVVDGKFKFSFVVPKDISYQYGFGKISYYATNGQTDASGFNNDFYVGGSTDQILSDSKEPKVELFMEDNSFKFGDMVSSSPLFIANVFDENGINTVGNGIGRDIVAILDKGSDNEKIIILNSYYSNKLDSYQAGEIRYPMGELQPGKHSIHFKIWDSYNNSMDAYTEFVVGPKDKMEINELFSYPNPATDQTTIVFNHNKGGMKISTDITISSIEGKVIYYNNSIIENAPTRVEIDSRDAHFLTGWAAGMYIIKLIVSAEDGSEDFAYGKLIIR